MKRFFVIVTLFCVPLLASADAVKIDGIYYYLHFKGYAEVTCNPT